MKNAISLGTVAAGIMVLSVFLPWLSVSSSGSFAGIDASYNFGNVSGISLGGGSFVLVSSLIGGFLFYRQIKWGAILGALNFLLGIGYLMGWVGASNTSYNASSSFGGYTTTVQSGFEPQFGLFVLMAGAALFMVASLRIKNVPAVKEEESLV